ncbi:MAG: hypothetical protein HYY98_16950 [Burkholderiales bacterium]|nr:hypothetical protein [Burkholderiales bacterium]
MSAPIQVYGPYRRNRLRRCTKARALSAWLAVALLVGLSVLAEIAPAYGIR